MNKNELQDILREYGINRANLDSYYLYFADLFSEFYISVFTEKKILELQDSYSIIQDSRLPLNDLFSKDEVEEISFDDNHVFYLNGVPYLEMNTKNQAKKMWITSTDLTSMVYIDTFLDFLPQKDRMVLEEKIQEYQEKLVFLSYFYKYVLVLLEEKARTKIDNVRAGYFTNAYFDIINYKKMELNNGRNV